MDISKMALWILAVVAILMTGCTATQSFSTAARAGDTVALAIGWNKPVNRNNLAVTFQPSSGAAVTYLPGDIHIRAVVQLPPDPLSQLIVGAETGQDFGKMEGSFLGPYINNYMTNKDAEWNQSVVYVDLPDALSPGSVGITLSGPTGTINGQPIIVDVLPGTGAANNFYVPYSTTGYAAGYWLPSVERRNYYTVTFAGTTIPNSIQIDLTHSVGAAIPWVVNPRGDLKNLSWNDDGSTNLRVMLTPSHGVPLAHMKQFKFYVAGGITGLAVASLVAYDAAGSLVAGITPTITYTP